MSEFQTYWDYRGSLSYEYKGESFYTVTPIPYYYRRRALLLDMMTPHIKEEAVKDVCDFGCGDGWYIKYFSSKYPGKRYYGVDISKSMIGRARLTAPSARLEASQNGICLDAEFDLIYCIAVLAHVQDKELPSLVTDIYNHMRSGGKFMLFEQTGPKRRDGSTWHRRMPQEYIQYAVNGGFAIQTCKLIAFPFHRFFERRISPYLPHLLARGRTHQERGIYANGSRIYRALSTAFLILSGTPIYGDIAKYEGNTFFVMEKQ